MHPWQQSRKRKQATTAAPKTQFGKRSMPAFAQCDALDRLPPEMRDRYRGMVQIMTAEAIAKEGIAAIATSRRSAAYHEAGHAVVRCSLNLDMYSVRVNRECVEGIGIWAGFARGEPIGSLATPGPCAAEAAIVLAGFASEKLFNVATLASSLDEQALAGLLMQQCAALLGRPDDACALFLSAWRETTEVLKRNQQSVQRIAIRLMDQKVVSGRLLKRLLRDVEIVGQELPRRILAGVQSGQT